VPPFVSASAEKVAAKCTSNCDAMLRRLSRRRIARLPPTSCSIGVSSRSSVLMPRVVIAAFFVGVVLAA
jgi:hypothetical protein